jgi:hypothetical protein
MVADHPEVPAYRPGLANGLLKVAILRAATGDPSGSLGLLGRAESILATPPVNPFQQWDRARAYALIGLADPAMDALRLAVAHGFLDRRRIATESDLESLHSRADFRDLVFDLFFPADPFAPASEPGGSGGPGPRREGGMKY